MIVRLEQFDDSHISRTFAWISDPDLRKKFMVRGEVSWDNHVRYFQKVLNDPRRRVYAIIVDGVHVGNCGIKEIRQEKKEGELWIYIGASDHWGKGIGQEAFGLLLREATKGLGLESLCVHLSDMNTAAKKLYRQFDFRQVVMASNESAVWAGRGEEVIRMEVTARK